MPDDGKPRNVSQRNSLLAGRKKRPVLSCAECRSRKVKCDRQRPCGSCIKTSSYRHPHAQSLTMTGNVNSSKRAEEQEKVVADFDPFLNVDAESLVSDDTQVAKQDARGTPEEQPLDELSMTGGKSIEPASNRPTRLIEPRPRPTRKLGDCGYREPSVRRCLGCNEAWRRPIPDLDSMRVNSAENPGEYMKLASNMIDRLRSERKNADAAYDDWKWRHSHCYRDPCLHAD